MPTTARVRQAILSGELNETFTMLYGAAAEAQKKRYLDAVDAYVKIFGEEEISIFSSPGRTEIGGNHTDHNRGTVLCGSVNLDVIAIASPAADTFARVYSDHFAPDVIDQCDQGHYPNEEGHSASLIRGIAHKMQEKGLIIGGYHAYTTSNVPKGSGVSSSAAFEVLLCTIQNWFYNEGKIPPIEIAKISQYAEREYFGKPCGLMDQAACALGGISRIDFRDEADPVVVQNPFRFADSGYKLCLVAVGGDHSDLTAAYAAIPARMKQVAGFFGKEVLREITLSELMANLPAVRDACGDAAVLAALHFLQENERVPLEDKALSEGDFEQFLRLVNASGHSSFEYLQNVLIPVEGARQGAAIALNLAAFCLEGKGAWRIHGGGFGGTTQNFVPDEMVPAFRNLIESVFGKGSCHVLFIRPVGPIRVI